MLLLLPFSSEQRVWENWQWWEKVFSHAPLLRGLTSLWWQTSYYPYFVWASSSALCSFLLYGDKFCWFFLSFFDIRLEGGTRWCGFAFGLSNPDADWINVRSIYFPLMVLWLFPSNVCVLMLVYSDSFDLTDNAKLFSNYNLLPSFVAFENFDVPLCWCEFCEWICK
jgi:hypothetical protein